MSNASDKCLDHYTNNARRCNACAQPIHNHYILHHEKKNATEHKQLIVEELGLPEGTWATTSPGENLRVYLVNTNYKTDEEFPLALVCRDCHAFIHTNDRWPTTPESAEFHNNMANRHLDALSYLISNPDHSVDRNKCTTNLGEFGV